LRDGKRYPFIHTLGEMLAMAAEIGPNVGVLLDCWHWYTSGGTVEEIRALRPEQVVYVHVNDAPAGVPVDEQVDSVRRVPGATGIINIYGFLRALRAIGYDGPVTPEPFDKELAELPTDADRLSTVGSALTTIFDRAGVLPAKAEKAMEGVRANIVAERTVRFQSFELPKEPTGAQVLVRLERTIVSAGTELANFTGLEPDTRVPGKWCYYPWRPGYGGIGRILKLGPGAPSTLEPGRRVYGIFHHASHAVVDASWQLCVPVPETLDATTAVMARMCGVAITAYQRARVTLGDTVVIIGLGLVGNLAGQFFLRAGQRVIGLDLSPQRRALAEQVGFTRTLDPACLMDLAGIGSETRLARAAKQLACGVRPPVVVDAVGDSRLVEQAVHLVADNGQVIMLGTPRAAYASDCTVAPEARALPRRGYRRRAGMDDPAAEAAKPRQHDRAERRADPADDRGRRAAGGAALLARPAARGPAAGLPGPGEPEGRLPRGGPRLGELPRPDAHR
jgi:threonine dehydrogenase-like Zn-dependent dehydrogenase